MQYVQDTFGKKENLCLFSKCAPEPESNCFMDLQ